ncbi:MAG TPA: pitrilysin family protein [Ktedonobacterales bacterium]|jgi:predicted Zn-dependent peptidase|nr:pitrilysin family protein [Ktedonobacterales bacterium]
MSMPDANANDAIAGANAPTSGELAPNYFMHTFANGLRMVGQRMPSLASVTFGVQVPAGIRDEPEDRLGLTYLLSDMMFQGTEHRNVRQLTEEFEEIGARKGGENAMEYGRYTAQIVGNRFDRALDLLADVMLHPTIPDDEFNQMRAVQLQDIRRRDDEPMRRIFDLVRERFYAGTTLGRRSLGARESVEKLTPDDLRSFYRTRYKPQGALISIAGAFDWDHAVERVGALFGEWSGAAPATPPQHPQPKTGVNVEISEGNQEHIGMAFPFPTYGDPDYYAANVVLEIFGGGMTSRLFREVREKRGLVYSVAALFAPNGEYGAGYLYAGASPDKARETVTVMLDELKLLQEQGVTQDELERAKTQIKSELVMRGESSAARMGALARSWWFEKRLITIQELKAAIDGVTAEQIMGLLKRFPPTTPLVLGAIGPHSEEELVGDALAKLG